MAPFDSPGSSSSPRPLARRTKSFARKCERCCCAIATCFPLAFVYGLATWAVWVEAKLGFMSTNHSWSGFPTSVLGVALYLLLITSYTLAVFTDPGSPSNNPASKSSRNGYSHLPTTEPRSHIEPSFTSITVNSSGAPRFCKKCLAPKPDRAHHCSSCKRCVLKMDHHCPWLATCVGLHNYKPFLLFLIYTSIFCWVCMGVSAQWIWAEVLSDEQYLETLMPINVVMLAVIAGIIGIVLTGFTAWHISLACRGITTIECLEKTRYLNPMRKAHQQQLLRQQDGQDDAADVDGNTNISGMLSNTLHKAGEQILTIHANAIPGATRVEEGEEHSSPTPHRRSLAYHSDDVENSYDDDSSQITPAQASLARHYRSPASREASLERRRYQEYLDEEFAPKLPHAFNLGWRRNLLHLFGSNPWLWWLPICNTSGDGWRWEISQKWLDAREKVAEERRLEEERVGIRGGHYEQDRDYSSNGDRYTLGNDGRSEVGSGMSMKTLSLKRKPSSRADIDRGEAGEIDSFQVSGSSDEDDEDDSVNIRDDTDRESGAGWKRW